MNIAVYDKEDFVVLADTLREKTGTVDEMSFPKDFLKSYLLINNNLDAKHQMTEYSNETATLVAPYAFYDLSNLTGRVNLPNVTTIGNSAFEFCKLSSIVVQNVVTIGEQAFYSCASLHTINLPKVTNIGNYAFSYCRSLMNVVIEQQDCVCNLAGVGAFEKTLIESGTGFIYVPDSMVELYKNATNWSVYANQIRPLSEYAEV